MEEEEKEDEEKEEGERKGEGGKRFIQCNHVRKKKRGLVYPRVPT